MKLFFFITKSEQGGAQTHVAQLAEFFVSRGDSVAIMSAPGGWLEYEAQRIGASFFPNPLLGNTADLMRLWRAHKTFLESVKTFEPDLVACHSTIAGLIGRLSLRRHIPTVFTAHGWGFTQGAPLLRRLVLPKLEHLAALWTDQIICVSKNDLALATHYRIASEKKLSLVHNGIQIPNPLEKPVDQEKIKIIFVGRLAAPKEPLRLLEAFMDLPQQVKNRVVIEIVGDGPKREALERFIQMHHLENPVHLLGDIPHKEVTQHLQQSSIFVLPTRWEGFPYTILEAMASGLPIIASRVGGIPEALDGVGVLIEKENTQALTHALLQLIEHPERCDALGSAGRNRVQEKFSLQEMCAKTLNVYESILKSRRT